MKKLPGKIILIDDEKSEKPLLELALSRKDWQPDLIYFSDAKHALEYLRKTDDELFLIICDLNMPGMNGFDLKKKLDADPAFCKKAIPFIFISNSAEAKNVANAYSCHVQGYFKKPIEVEQQSEELETILKYWSFSRHPDRQ